MIEHKSALQSPAMSDTKMAATTTTTTMNTATMTSTTAAMTAQNQNTMASGNAMASKVVAPGTEMLYTWAHVESPPVVKEQEHKSSFQRKKEKRRKEEWKKALRPKIEELRLDEEERRKSEIREKTTAMHSALVNQSKRDNFEFKKDLLVDPSEEIWTELSKQEQNAIIAYTGIEEICYSTMNAILRDGSYKKDKTNFDANHGIEQSKRNYDAVTNCISALKKSKLPKDMVFRRGTDLQTLSFMLGINLSNGNEDIGTQIKKHIDKFNNGEQIVVDKGFFSTSPIATGGLPGEVEWIIQGHEGDEALYVDNYSDNHGEEETIFQAGTRFRVLKIETNEKTGTGKWNVYLETLPGLEPLRGENI